MKTVWHNGFMNEAHGEQGPACWQVWAARWVSLLIAAALACCAGGLWGCTSGAGSASPASPADEEPDGVPAELVEGIDAIPYEGEAGGPDPSDVGAAGGSAPLAATEGGGSAAAGGQEGVAQGPLRVRFLDVGQGDAALVSCNGMHLLIDGGPPKASSKLYAVLQGLGIDHLDYIVASHPDADHCGGIAGALNYASCGMFFCSVAQHDTKTFNNVVNYLGDVPITVPTQGAQYDLGGATLQFIGQTGQAGDTNNGSLICTVRFGEVTFLFTGDAEAEAEDRLLWGPYVLKADVLKVGHHGSNSSSTSAFLAKVSPQYAVISVGKNSYGHPTEGALGRLAAAGAEILRTDQLGTITFDTDGTSLAVSHTTGEVER